MEFRHRGIQCFAPRIDDDGPLRAQLIQMQADGLADAPFDAVTHDGLAERARHGKADLRTRRLGFAHAESGEQGTREAGPVVVDPAEILGSEDADTFRETRDGYYLSSLTVSFLRPRARRRERTARPFLVSIRERNPCVFARWRLFGWKVRFGILVQVFSIGQRDAPGQIGLRSAAEGLKRKPAR